MSMASYYMELYHKLKRHLFLTTKVYTQQARADEQFFGPHDEYTKRSRAAAAALEHLIKTAGLEEDFKEWEKEN